jgi:hypothetical protein
MTEKEPSLLRIVLAFVVAGFVFSGAWKVVWKYIIREHVSHDMLTTVHHHGSWAIGEYQDCNSINGKEETSPDLSCGDASEMDTAKTFMVRFSGDLPYDKDKKEGAVHLWKCRHNSDAEIAFTCFRVRTETEATEPQPAQAQPESAPQRELTSEEIENLRKRNQCENRFAEKGIYQVNGVTVGIACKQNPDLNP